MKVANVFVSIGLFKERESVLNALNNFKVSK